MKNQDLVERIIEFSKDNTGGTILSEKAIESILKVCNKKSTPAQLDIMIGELQTDEGYLVKTGDFIEVLKDVPEKGEEETPKFHRKEFNRLLEYKFNDEEILKFSYELSEKLTKIGEVESRKKSAMSQFKSEIDVLIAEIKELSNKIHSGTEERRVDCEAHYYYDRNVVEMVRLDTGEVFSEGEIPENERQVEMYDKDENGNSEEQSPDTEASDTEKEKSDGDGTETEEIFEEIGAGLQKIADKTVDEQQAELDKEDEKIADEISTNLSQSEKADLFQSDDFKAPIPEPPDETSLPKLPNE